MRFSELEQSISKPSRVLRLDSIRSRILFFAVFATSYEVTENLELTARRGAAGPSQRRLNDYLNSVRERFGEYVELMVVDPQGKVIATSARQIRQVQMPPHWTNDVLNDGPAIGDPYHDEGLGTTLVVVAVPIHVPSGRFLGALTAKISLGTMDQMFKQ